MKDKSFGNISCQFWQEELNEVEKAVFEDSQIFRSKDIVLYGAGKLGILAFDVLRQVEIIPCYYVDVNRTGSLNGISIIKPEDIDEKDKVNKLFVICVSTVSYKEIEGLMQSIGIVNYIQFYTYAYMMCGQILNNGWMLKDDIFSIMKSKEILESLYDEKSKAHYMSFLWWKRANIEKIYPKFEIEQKRRFFESELVRDKLDKKERYLDIGSYSGKLIDQFLSVTNSQFDKILAIEPDRDSFEKLSKRSNDKIQVKQVCIGAQKQNDVYFRGGMGYASKIASDGKELIDVITLCELDFTASIIKIHAEGNEMAILEGGIDYLIKTRPILMVLADHDIEGYYDIPMLIMKKLPNYNIYFRLHDYCGNTAVFYFIPKER